MARAIVEIFELINYVNGGSRPFEEGSRILNSNHILLCGLINTTKSGNDQYFALCLRSTSLTIYPHEINITISVQNEKKSIEAHCTCQAGASGKCKHVVGVLLYLNKRTKDSIEKLGCTDLRQQWGQIKNKVSEAYAVEPFNKFCHGSQVNVKYEKSSECRMEILKILCEADVESEMSQHSRCYRSEIEFKGTPVNLSQRVLKTLNKNSDSNIKMAPVVYDLNEIYSVKKSVIDESALDQFLKNNIWSKYLKNFQMKIFSKAQALYFNKFLVVKADRSKKIFLDTVMQNDKTWHEERSKRITGSICYSLYTYMKNTHSVDDWTKKLNTTFKSSFSGNKHTLHGKECEEAARKAYEKVTNNKIQEGGLFILPSTSWFGYSADGIVNKDILIELKCPKNDNGLTADILVKTLPYIAASNNDQKLILKSRHMYYGQVQLGMCLYGLLRCHFVIYESNNDTCIVIEVERNDEFVADFVTTLSLCYFTHILPWLTSNQEITEKEN